ncbi:MAG: T9SS type A sorting domain-containing protein [Bacteroidota bacterium]
MQKTTSLFFLEMNIRVSLFALLFPFLFFAQPVNDDCDFATQLIPSGDLTCTSPVHGTVLSATASTQGNSCSSGNDDDDVWYKFTATGTTHKVTLSNIAGLTIDMYFAVYANPCASLGTQILCSDNNSANLTALTAGQEYFIRVYTKTSITNMDTQFDICVSTPPEIPLNNECSAAAPLFVNALSACDSVSLGTINGATASTQANGCTGTVYNDVWYSFVATQTAHYVTIVPQNESPTDYYHAVYGGTCTSPGTAIRCSDPNSSTVTGLIAGNTYFLRVYTTTAIPDGIVSDFSVCVSTPPTPPMNDECVNAIELDVNEDFQCGLFTNGTVVNALRSNQPYTCSDYTYITADDDVWYKFTATRTTHSLRVFNLGGDSPSVNYAVYSGNCTSTGSAILCYYTSSSSTNLLNNLIVGNEYLIRIFSRDDDLPHTTTFSICIGSEPRPANDECAGATNLMVNILNSCSGTYGDASTLYATLSPDVTSCPTSDAIDTWYKFTASDTSHVINLYGQYVNSTDHLEYDVYAGSCGNFTQALLCNVNYANQLNDLNIGETYYVKLHSNIVSIPPTTAFCIRTVNNRPANDECDGAPLIDINNDLICDTVYTGSLANATPSGTPTNTASHDDDVWVKFKANRATQAITIVDLTNSNQYFSLYFYKNCNDVTQLDAAYYLQAYTLQNLIPDSIYYIRIASAQSSAILSSNFELCIKNADVPVNDECSGATAIPVNTSNECLLTAAGTIYKATASPESNSCTATSDDDDVWFRFQAENPVQIINLAYVSGSSATLKYALYSGNCGTLNQVGCYAVGVSAITDLVPGDNYFMRVYSEGTTSSLTTNFNICIAQPPVNDECYNSIEVPVNADFECVQDTTGSLRNATYSGFSNSCVAAGTNDIWYHFVATSTTHWVTLSQAYDTEFSVYDYNCGNPGTPLLCHTGVPNYDQQGAVSNLTVGDTFLVRVYNGLNTNPFRICILTPPPPPPNDECINAIDIPVNNSFVCDTMLSCSVTAGVTRSTQTLPSCVNSNSLDVWYKFTATSSKMEIDFFSTSDSPLGIYKALYSGSCGSPGTELFCNSIYDNALTNLSIGHTYYLRVFAPISESVQVYDFKICVKLMEVPANDECINAYNAPVNMTTGCDTVVHGTLFHATTSVAGTYCGGGVPVNDVWFKFVAQHTKHNIQLIALTNTPSALNTSNVRFNVYSGICGNLGTPLLCSIQTFGSLTNLTIGATYYVRVFNANTTTNLNLNFDLCITIPSPPVNDECPNATLVQSEEDNSCSLTTAGTLNNATPSVQANSCANTSDQDDVWYKFVATSPEHAVNFMNVLSNTDIYHTVYSGNCQSLNTLVCSDPNSSLVSGLTVDSTYYVRVYSVSNLAQTTTFKICTGPYLPLPGCTDNTPAGNDCYNATAVCDFNGYCGRTAGTYTVDSWTEFGSTFCGTLENDSFLSFVPDSSSVSLNVWVTSSFTGLGIQVFIFSADSCQGPVQNYACWDPHYVPPGHKLITANGLTPGNKYYLMVDGQSGDICDYVFGSASNISNPVNINPVQADICLGDSILLTATGGDGTFNWPASPEITEITENTAYFKPALPGMNSVFVSSFVNNPGCSLSSEIEYQVNVRECICPVTAAHNSDSCASNSFDLFASDVFGASYSWSGPDFTSTDQNPANIQPPGGAGTYTYTVTATNGTETCSTSTDVVINAIPDAAFSYTDTLFCINSGNILPVVSGQSGGVFNADLAGIGIDNTSGEIDFSASVPGDYVISYTTSGFCPQTAMRPLSILYVPLVDAAADQEICPGESFNEVLFSGQHADLFSWTNDTPSIGLTSNGTGNIPAFEPAADNLQAAIEVTPYNEACAGSPVSFTLTVLESPDVTLNPMNDLCSYIQSVSLTNGSPAGGTYSGSSVVNNVFHPSQLAPGTYAITYSYTDGASGCTDSATVNVQVLDCASLAEIGPENGIRIFPNPTQGELNIEISESFSYELLDAKGKLVTAGQHDKSLKLNVNSLADGLYYLQIRTAGQTLVQLITVN